MKNILPLFLATLFFSTPFYVSAALTDSLVSYWELDEFSDGSAPVSREDSHSTNHLTDNNTTASAAGKTNNGTDFESANSEFLSITDAAQTGLDIATDMAISFWYKQESAPATDTRYEFLGKTTDTSGAYNFIYWNSGGTLQLVAQLYDDGSPGTNENYAKTTTITTDTWTHIVFSFKASTGTMTFYRDGSSLGTTVNTAVNQINNSPGNFFIGAHPGTSPASSNYVDGTMDEIGIWSRELTSTEVTELYNGGVGLTYPFATSSPSITGSGTANRIAKFTSGNSIGNSLFSDDGSNVTLTSGNLFMAGSSLLDTITNGAINFGTTMATTMTFGRSGQNLIINSNVGIGTTTPLSLLHVQGDIKVGTLSTLTNCASSASPAVCGSASAGSVAMSTGTDTLTVNTTVVTPNSQILIMEDASLGGRLGITCNTGTIRSYRVSARATSTSFTIKASNNPTVDKVCFSYWIVN